MSAPETGALADGPAPSSDRTVETARMMGACGEAAVFGHLRARSPKSVEKIELLRRKPLPPDAAPCLHVAPGGPDRGCDPEISLAPMLQRGSALRDAPASHPVRANRHRAVGSPFTIAMAAPRLRKRNRRPSPLCPTPESPRGPVRRLCLPFFCVSYN